MTNKVVRNLKSWFAAVFFQCEPYLHGSLAGNQWDRAFVTFYFSCAVPS